jgi:hypothetical protein
MEHKYLVMTLVFILSYYMTTHRGSRSSRELSDLLFDAESASDTVSRLELRTRQMARAARKDSSVDIRSRPMSPEQQEIETMRLDRLQRISDSLAQQLIVAKQEERRLIQEVHQYRSSHNLISRPQYGRGNQELVNAYVNFRKAFARVQKAHMNGRNWIRRDSGLSQDIVESERQALASEIIEADAQLVTAERILSELS